MNNSKIKFKDKIKNKKAITLLALVVTIIVLLILAGVSLNLIAGGDGWFKKADEAIFKSQMSQIAEEFELYKSSERMESLLSNRPIQQTNAGSVLKDMVNKLGGTSVEEDPDYGYDDGSTTDNGELSGITAESIEELEEILESVKPEHDDFLIIVKDTLYYVCSSTVQEDEKAKWCTQIGIPIWYYNPEEVVSPSTVGINNTRGDYTKVNGTWVCTPVINKSAFSKYNTRYVLEDEKGNLSPGTWINKRPDPTWYDYDEQKWANLYIENDGIDSYWVWIPRYVFKTIDGERVDAKFVDTENNHKDQDDNEILWADLQSQGYELPEAFQFDGKDLPGYWISKYQLSEHLTTDEYVLYFETVSTMSTIKVQSIQTTSSEIVKYQYALNGEILHESKDGSDYTFTGLVKGNKTINVTGLDKNGEIVGSFTYYFEVAEVNPPDVSAFDPDTTFYVTYDEDGTEHNEIPVSLYKDTGKHPENWYDYTVGTWANIVTRNNGVETYWVWIPRYQFQANETAKRTLVRFIKGTSNVPDEGYEIPEAFTFNGTELTGYWISKYQLSTETANQFINAEMSAGSNIIRVLGITGDGVADGQIYEYYLNGIKDEYVATSAEEQFVFDGLQPNTTYTVNVIVRDAKTNAYVGAVTRKVKTIEANPPVIDKFDSATTFYVTYDDKGNETRTPFADGQPDNWYDYSAQKWANVVTTAGDTETYWVWIPRYELRILEDRDVLSLSNRRTEVNFLSGTEATTTTGYEIPEAFTFAGQELTGYWITKYQLSQ